MSSDADKIACVIILAERIKANALGAAALLEKLDASYDYALMRASRELESAALAAETALEYLNEYDPEAQ